MFFQLTYSIDRSPDRHLPPFHGLEPAGLSCTLVGQRIKVTVVSGELIENSNSFLTPPTVGGVFLNFTKSIKTATSQVDPWSYDEVQMFLSWLVGGAESPAAAAVLSLIVFLEG